MEAVYPSLTDDIAVGLLEKSNLELGFDPTSALDNKGKLDMDLIRSAIQYNGCSIFEAALTPQTLSYYPIAIREGDNPFQMAAALWQSDLPVCIQRQVEPQDFARRDLYFLALTGSGMNFAWHLAGAYILCGFLPPLHILNKLLGAGDRGPEELRQRIIDSFEEVRDHLAGGLEQLQQVHLAIRDSAARFP